MVPGNQHRAAIEVDLLERDAFLALGQVGGRRVQPVGDLVRFESQQPFRILVEVEHHHAVVDLRVSGQWQHCRAAHAAGREPLGDVQQRSHRDHIDQAGGESLVAQLQRVIPQSWLRGPEQARQADQRAHVGQGLVRVASAHAVVFGQVLQLEAGALAILALAPPDALGPQRMRHAHDVEQVPARIAAAPFPFVGIEEVPEQPMPDELIVETQRVVTERAGFRSRHFLDDAGERLGFVDAFAQRMLRGDAGDQGGDGRGQQVVGGANEQADRFIDLVELGVGADRGELRDARAARVAAESLEVVEKEAGGHSLAFARHSRGRGSSR